MKKLRGQLAAWAIIALLPAIAAGQGPEELEAERQALFRGQMESIVADLNRGNFDSFIGAIDQQDMLERIYGLRLIDQQVKKSFAERLEYTWDDIILSGFSSTEGAFDVKLLGVESRGQRGRAVVRFDLPKFQFGYHEYELRLNDSGRMFIVDWTDYLAGKVFSDAIGESLVMGMPGKPAMRKLLDFRNVSDVELFQFGELLKASRDGKLDRYLEILAQLGERFQRQRVVVETTVSLAKRLRKRREMLAGLDTMANYYPGEPLYALMLLDHYFPQRKYREASDALLGLYRKLGFDDAAMEARLSAAVLVMGNTGDAAAHAGRALQLEPGLELGWWSALNARAALENYEEAVAALTVLAEEYGYELGRDALGRNPMYRGLLASAQYEAWLSSRQ
jgi:hypothetical protein